MSELSAFEQEVAATIKIIEERSVFHRTIIQPAVERFGGREVSGAEVEAAVGMMNVTILKQSTDYMIEGIYNVVAGSRVCSEKLRNAVKRMYPKQAILFLKAPDETKLPKG